jgi:thiol-disulfide isomerase/thioredoxin
MKAASLLWLAAITIACAPVVQAPGANSAPAQTAVDTAEPSTPEWFQMELKDVQTAEAFSISDFAGKVVLLETMAIWCPTCVIQATQVSKLHELLRNRADLVSISLDVDVNEDEAALKEYASSYRFSWRFATAPLGVARALGNLYSAEYLNPPLSPMLVIDRKGNVHQLEYGIKQADTLLKIVGAYLAE